MMTDQQQLQCNFNLWFLVQSSNTAKLLYGDLGAVCRGGGGGGGGNDKPA